MSYECVYCNFTAPTNTRLLRHLSTQKHAKNVALQPNVQDNVQDNVQETVQDNVQIPLFVENEEENLEPQQIMEELLQNVQNRIQETESIVENEDENVQEPCLIMEELLQNEDDKSTEQDYIDEEDINTQIMLHICTNTQMQKEEDEVDEWYSSTMNQTNIFQEDEVEKDNVQEEDDESPYNNHTFIDNFEIFILDIKTKEMIKNINDTLVSHPFILRMISIFMNIVCFFSPIRNTPETNTTQTQTDPL